MKKRDFDTSNLPEKPPAMRGRKKSQETKNTRIGLEAHEYLRKEAFKRNITMIELLDEIIEKYKN
uniref:hypothetical protein n=1 Tax=Carnobacterium sp. TaxID=48221 RepID=UPI00344E9E6F